MWYRKVEISFKRSLKSPETGFNGVLFIKTWEKRTVVPWTDVTTIEDIRKGKYSGDGFRLFQKFQLNYIELFWYNVFVFHRSIYKGENREIHFYRCPNSKLYKKWSQLINRKDFKVTKSTKVCSNHFSALSAHKTVSTSKFISQGIFVERKFNKEKTSDSSKWNSMQKEKVWEFLKCLTSEERNEVQNPPDKKNKEPRSDFQDLSLSSVNLRRKKQWNFIYHWTEIYGTTENHRRSSYLSRYLRSLSHPDTVYRSFFPCLDKQSFVDPVFHFRCHIFINICPMLT